MSIFDLPDDAMVITSTFVMKQGMPILDVMHGEFEGRDLWQFHCGNGDFSSRHLMMVRLDTIMCHDPSLLELSELELGMRARRTHIDGEWTIEPLSPAEEE